MQLNKIPKTYRRQHRPGYTVSTEVINLIVKCKAFGLSIEETATALNDAGYRNRHGDPWTSTSVHSHWYKNSTTTRAKRLAKELGTDYLNRRRKA